jgi:membrane protein required for colicin V production
MLDLLSEIDWIFVAILLISTLIGVSRGMVCEIFALLGWVAAAFISVFYAPELAEKLPISSVGPLVRSLIAVVLIVIGCVFGAGMIGKLIRAFLSSISIGPEDRILGALFGFVRGFIIVTFIVYLGGASEMVSAQTWWKKSTLAPEFAKALVHAAPYLPKDLLGLNK